MFKPPSFSRRAFFVRIAALLAMPLAGGTAQASNLSRRLGRIWVSRPTWLGGLGLRRLPAIPIDLAGVIDSLPRLVNRLRQIEPAQQGLTNPYTLQGRTATAFEWVYGDPVGTPTAKTRPPDPAQGLEDLVRLNEGAVTSELQSLALPTPSARGRRVRRDSSARQVHLEDPVQFTMAWTNYLGIYAAMRPFEAFYAASLTDPHEATAQFWPTLNQGGVPFNLLVLRKVVRFRSGAVYVIDLDIFQQLQPHVIDGVDRFTPATRTWLWMDARTRTLRPIYITVSGYQGAGRQSYSQRDPSWLYALQAAKTSITVYGIWLGHAYTWHLVSGAMQMTLQQQLPGNHPLNRLLAPQSNYNMAFNNILFLAWLEIGPPTSVDSPQEFLALCDEHARGRGYFDDDPPAALRRLGLDPADFTVHKPWDLFPLARHYLEIWAATERYVGDVVDATYPDDRAVRHDGPLQAWIEATRFANGGNLAGLPHVRDVATLKAVLTSYLFRITIHGVSRLTATLFPTLSFASNFPPCLHRRDIPTPDTPLSTRELLTYLPTTDTLGKYVDFLYFFIFSDPYERLVPETGVTSDLFFPGGPHDPRNQALIRYRQDILRFTAHFDPTSTQASQWPLNIET